MRREEGPAGGGALLPAVNTAGRLEVAPPAATSASSVVATVTLRGEIHLFTPFQNNHSFVYVGQVALGVGPRPEARKAAFP